MDFYLEFNETQNQNIKYFDSFKITEKARVMYLSLK